MFHWFGTVTSTKGDGLTGWQVECVHLSDGSTVVPIYADENLTPVQSVSGVADRAVTDSAGNYDFFVQEGTYSLRFYNAQGVFQRLQRYMPMYGNAPEAAIAAMESAQAAQEAAEAAAQTAQYSANATVYGSWADLAAASGMTAGDSAIVFEDAGTHTDPVTSATVDNAGIYVYSAAPTGWERVADTEAVKAATSAAEAEASALYAEAMTGPTYASTAAGLAATSNGQGFAVDAGGGLVSVYLNSAGTAVLQRTLATAAYLASSAGAGAVGFIQSGTGAVTRTVQDKLRDVVSVKDFGALGDNSANDTAAIQAAIDAAAAAGGEVYFPVGTYRFTALTISGRVALRFASGANLVKTTTTGNGISIVGSGSRIFGIKIEGRPRMSALAACTAGAMIYVENAGQVALDVRIDQFPAAAYRGIELYNVSQAVLDGAVQNCVERGLYARDCLDVTLKPGSRFDANGTVGVEMDTVSGVYGYCTAYGNGTNNYRLVTTIGSPVLADTNGFHFWTGAIADTGGAHNWYCESLYRSVFDACWGATQSSTTTDQHGFYFKDCGGIEMSNSIAENCNGSGLFNDNSDIIVTGGRYNHNGVQAGSTDRAGITAQGASAKLIIDGSALVDRFMGAKTQTYGLNVKNTIARLKVTHSDLTDNAGAPYVISATPAEFYESGNSAGESENIASAATITLPWFGQRFVITGNTNIGTLNTMYKGRRVDFMFTGTPSVLPGFGLVMAGNFAATANDTISFMCADGATVVEMSRSVNA